MTSFAAFAGIVAFQIPAGLLCLRIAPLPLLRCTVLALIVCVMAIAAVADLAGPRGVAVFVLGGLIDLVYTVGLITLANSVARDRLAIANACFVSFCGLGEVAGPAVTGPALAAFGLGGAIGVVLLLLAAYWSFSVHRGEGASGASPFRLPDLPPAGAGERRAGMVPG
jgi:predicted MFS family arabinose efflux permease